MYELLAFIFVLMPTIDPKLEEALYNNDGYFKAFGKFSDEFDISTSSSRLGSLYQLRKVYREMQYCPDSWEADRFPSDFNTIKGVLSNLEKYQEKCHTMASIDIHDRWFYEAATKEAQKLWKTWDAVDDLRLYSYAPYQVRRALKHLKDNLSERDWRAGCPSQLLPNYQVGY